MRQAGACTSPQGTAPPVERRLSSPLRQAETQDKQVLHTSHSPGSILHTQSSDDSVGNFLRPRVPSQISSLNAIDTRLLDSPHDHLASFVLSQPIEHLTRCPESTDGVRQAHPGDIECRPMDGFEH